MLKWFAGALVPNAGVGDVAAFGRVGPVGFGADQAH